MSGHRAGIPNPGKSHEHVKEQEDGKEPEVSLPPFYNNALSLEDKMANSRLYHLTWALVPVSWSILSHRALGRSQVTEVEG